jgi:hypothetical protein
MWISFVLPGAAFTIRTRGRVVWVHRNPDENDPTDAAGMGIEFMDLNDAERAACSDPAAVYKFAGHNDRSIAECQDRRSNNLLNCGRMSLASKGNSPSWPRWRRGRF